MNTDTTLLGSAPQPTLRGRVASIAGAIAQAEALPLVGLLALVFAVYVPTLNDYFHGDDFLAFIDLTTKSPLHQVVDTFLFKDSNVYWRPLGQVWYLAIYEPAGLDPFYFHLASVGVFLATLAVLYRFCLNFGLGRPVALGAVLVFGIVPNHVISVAWTTNAPRLLATLFALVCVVLLQEGLRSGQRRYELLAFFAMVASTLCDEVAVTLTLVPVLYMLLAQPDTRPWAWQHLLRGLFYGALGLAVGLLQVFVGRDAKDAPVVIGLSELSIGWHILRDYWALTAKLVFPVHDGIVISDILASQWVAGAVAIAAAAVAVAFGTRRVLVLVAWIVLALTPFTLWTTPISPARYVYMAALPFAVLASWLVVAALTAFLRGRVWRLARRLHIAPLFGLAGAGLVAAGVFVAASATMERNDAFARTAAPYRILAEELPRAVPVVASNSRLVIYYGVWDGSTPWQDAVVETVYRDRTLHTINVDRTQTDAGVPHARPSDLIVFYTDRGFIVPAPSTRVPTSPPRGQPAP